MSQLAAGLKITPILASLLINREINDEKGARTFLYPGLHNLGDPFALPDMEAAVNRISQAFRRKERILVYGDYDVDGITATALLTLFLRQAGLEVDTYLPGRITEGYGLHYQPLSKARKAGVGLVITVDCGTDSLDVIQQAARIGLEVIVTDHHLPRREPRENLSAEHCLVNPHLGHAEEFKTLAGVGVALELARAVARTLDRPEPGLREEDVLNDYLDLAAIGTIADLAPLRGESRTIACLGLQKLQNSPRPAITELCRQAGMRKCRIDTQAIGFVIGPRINAAGRLNNANLALKLFLSREEEEIVDIAGELEKNNRERQKIGKNVFKAVRHEIIAQKMEQNPVIILSARDWHQGVLGIVAGKVAEEYRRPAIILTLDDDNKVKGSGRSVPGIDLFQAVKSCARHLADFGGHQKAIGLSAAGDKLPDFCKALTRVLSEQPPASGYEEPSVRVESVVNFHELTPRFIRELELLAPFGEDNPEPVIATMDAQVQDYSRVVGKRHLKLWLKKDDLFREAIGFGLSDWKEYLPPGTMVDVAYTPRVSTFEDNFGLNTEDGEHRLELKIHALRRKV